MSTSLEAGNYAQEVEKLRKAFEHEFERFAALTGEREAAGGVPLPDAEQRLRELAELRTRYTGKKGPLLALKKRIGSLPPEERAAFAMQVQALDAGIVERLNQIEALLQ